MTACSDQIREPDPDKKEDRATAWISRGFETLIFERSTMQPRPHFDFDVIIVGSGYGGAIAAAELAGCQKEDANKKRVPVTVCVLERGSEYLSGAFPSKASELPAHVRFSAPEGRQAHGNREGLFDVRIGADVSVLVANGLGGGSLINAGVMEVPKDKVFDYRWPKKLRDHKARNVFYDSAKKLLGAAQAGKDNTIALHADPRPAKFVALEAMGKASGRTDVFRHAAITVSMTNGINQAGVQLDACKACGDCATGCNYNAKNSLDVNLLLQAQRKNAEIYTGATVLKLAQINVDNLEGWSLDVVHTEAGMRKHQGRPYKLTARKVILAAGTFGSTEILLRSQSADLKFSEQLGQRFSTNGDMIAVGYGHSQTINAVADETTAPGGRKIGPTITGIIDLRQDKRGLLVEELAVPGPLRKLFEEMVTCSNTLQLMGKKDRTAHCEDAPDPRAVDACAIARTSVLAVMGNDCAQGQLELIGNDDEALGDGAIRIRWPQLRDAKLFSDQIDLLKKLSCNSQLAGTVFANPMWSLLPKSLEDAWKVKPGPLFTVHPLGGCAMGKHVGKAVVDDIGRVFQRDSKRVFEGLVVLDGSIIPCALGTNPALTIAALSLRAVEQLHTEWDYQKTTDKEGDIADKVPDISETRRPIFQRMLPPQQPIATEVELLERLAGTVMLKSPKGVRWPYVVEITLRFKSKPLADLMRQEGRTLAVGTAQSAIEPASRIRIFKPDIWQTLTKGLTGDKCEADIPWKNPDTAKQLKKGGATEAMFDDEAELIAPLSGHLSIFNREKSGYRSDRWRVLFAWLLNRGVREIWQDSPGLKNGTWRGLAKNWQDLLVLASHAREVRRLDYVLNIESSAEIRDAEFFKESDFAAGTIIEGYKRLRYARRANPWRQLAEMTLGQFPRMQENSQPVLELDTAFLAREHVPLFRIVKQQDHATALADMAAFGAYFCRILFPIHAWSFRKPDAPLEREPQRLPGVLKGLPDPEINELVVDHFPDGTPVRIRLTRYPRADSALPPIIMIHGYSISGTIFAHPSVNPNMASLFWQAGRDVWLLDLRTSSGMPTARHPWSFEDVAYADIPAAFDYIYREINKELNGRPRRKIDVLAHCMGSAMLSMSILAKPSAGDKYFRERMALPSLINKLALSQVGPVMVFSPANIFRGYIMRYVSNLLPFIQYEFRPRTSTSVPDQMLDRLLATMPYPRLAADEEFDKENPWWPPYKRTPFVSTRHRMDALYGRDFTLKNIGDETLEHIDDLFGPLNLQTVSQTMHFSRFQTITNRAGRNEYVSRARLVERWPEHTLSIHGVDNGLVDVATLARMKTILQDAGKEFKAHPVPDHGHLDCLIGREVQSIFDHISSFLSANAPVKIQQAQPAARSPALAAPWTGPIVGKIFSGVGGDYWPVSIVGNPVLGTPWGIAVVPITACVNCLCAVSTMEQIISGVSGVAYLSVRAGDDDWMQFDLPVSQWDNAAESLLLLVVYDESPELAEPPNWQIPVSNFSQLVKKVDLADVIDRDAKGIRTRRRTPKLPDMQIDEIPTEIIRLLKTLTIDDLHRSAIRLPARAQGADKPAAKANTEHEITFALASCQYPAGILDETLAYASYERINQLLDQPDAKGKPGFLVLAGDQVYVDATAGLFDPSAKDDRYVRPYEDLFRNRSVRSVLGKIPAYMAIDDHEIDDNWEPLAEDSPADTHMTEGRRTYLKYQRSAGQRAELACGDSRNPLWYSFIENSFPFFVADTRTERLPRDAKSVDDARIMSKTQMEKLLDWVDKQNRDMPKFIMSPSILLPRKLRATQGNHPASVLRSDAWEGYPNSLRTLLAHIAKNEIQHVVFLSGDEHLSCVAHVAISATTPNEKPGGEPIVKRAVIHSIHSSALYAPFPFANSIPADLKGNDNFSFREPDTGTQFDCAVTTDFAPPGDGFAVLRVFKNKGKWKLSCRFNREPVATQGNARHLLML